MSIHSEFDRYLKAVVEQLEADAWPGEPDVTEALRAAHSSPEDLSIRARRVLDVLERADISGRTGAEGVPLSVELFDNHENLTAISRIVLGL